MHFHQINSSSVDKTTEIFSIQFYVVFVDLSTEKEPN